MIIRIPQHFLLICTSLILLVLLLVLVPFEVHSTHENNCEKRCSALQEACLDLYEGEKNQEAKEKRKFCKSIFGDEKGFCLSLCTDNSVFDSCPDQLDDSYMTDDCFDDCENLNAMCVLDCSNQYKSELQLKPCWSSCTTMFSDSMSFCKVQCDADVNAFFQCEL